MGNTILYVLSPFTGPNAGENSKIQVIINVLWVFKARLYFQELFKKVYDFQVHFHPMETLVPESRVLAHMEFQDPCIYHS